MDRLKSSFKKLTRSLTLTRQSADERTGLIERKAKHQHYLESVPNVLVYKDYELPGDLIHPKVLDDLQDFEVRPTDILIVSYPQSGAGIVEDIVLQAVTKVNAKTETRRGRHKCQIAKLEVANPYGHMRWLNGLRSPRILTSSLPLDLLPEAVRNGVCKIIYVLRNPKDLSLSYYYHHRVKAILSSFDDFFDLYLDGHLLYGDYFTHVIDFWQLYKKYSKNVFFLSFEELKLETQAMSKVMFKFLDFDLTDEDMSQVLASSQKVPVIEEPANVAKKGKEQRHYEGVIGDWLNYYKPEQSRKVDDLMRHRFESLGLHLCCDPIEAERRLSKFGRIIVDTKTHKNRNRSETQNRLVAEKPKLAKEEYILLRHKSQNDVDIVNDRDSAEESECWSCCRCWQWCCPCLRSGIDYTKV